MNEQFPFKTIHKSKGDQFDAVLLILESNNGTPFNEDTELGFLLNPDLTKEEHRVNYVAASRAVNHLYINVPSLSQGNVTALTNLGFMIK